MDILYEPSGGANYHPIPELYSWDGEEYEFGGEQVPR